MGILRNRSTRRYSRLGLISDLALVGAAASRLVRRGDGPGADRASSGMELALAGGAAVRLLRRWRRRRARRRALTVDAG